jgi:hypothetical protein
MDDVRVFMKDVGYSRCTSTSTWIYQPESKFFLADGRTRSKSCMPPSPHSCFSTPL